MKGGPKADDERFPESATWSADGDFIRAAYIQREDDDDFGQAGTLVRDVMRQFALDRRTTPLCISDHVYDLR